MSRHVSITPFSVTRSDAGNRGVTSSISCKTVTNQAALFVFGDSLFEAGNNNYVDSLPGFRSNCWPNGKSTFQFSTGRVSDGRIMIDFIAEHAWLPLLPPNLQPGYSKSQLTYGLNFATTAVGVLAGTFPGVSKYLGTQQNRFKNATQVLRSKLGDGETRRVILKAVYLFHIGANDYQYISSQTRHLLVPRPKRGSWTSLSVTQRTINDPSRYGFKQGKMACCGSGPLRGVDTCGFRNGPSQGYELCENSGDY
ncbi:hypothetical protein HID58_053786 [Brassica napus]|uniref:GDSL esterase/lipase n=1 Tax=Brassica napus TaxID=3708 RepID=A0ABQ8AFN8_BRANA|nr:hypothetical protein HID58_053786 [Brassica napus]